MPALITHDMFGKDVYGKFAAKIGEDNDCFQAFLLGNQGPDPLFYALIMPLYYSYRRVASKMHKEQPSSLLHAFQESLSALNAHERPIGKAYFLGFICHYLLDSSAHPLVYYYQKELCGAGVQGLDAHDASEVHHVIEAEYDEVTLWTRQKKTIATFDPSTKILRANNNTLDIISKMYVFALLKTYGLVTPAHLFSQSVKNYRLAQSAMHSKTGFKRAILGDIESLFRRYSFLRAAMLQPIEREQSDFDNHQHALWRNPFTDEKSTKSLWDLYSEALERASCIIALSEEETTRKEFEALTKEINFSGQPTQPIIVEDGV